VSITSASRQLGYSKQSFFKSRRNKQLKCCFEQIVKQKVLAIRQQMPRLGVRKLHYMIKGQLIRENIPMGRDRLFALLRREKLLVMCKRKYTKTTNSRHWMHKYPDLVKQRKVQGPEQVWVADITYLRVGNDYGYLHLLTDAYSKKIMGYKVSADLSSVHTMDALKQALKQRQYPTRLTHHSDRGLQYCSAGYVQLLTKHDIEISMTQDGSPYDNAIAERVNGILKDEFGLDDHFKDLRQAEAQSTQAITLYNQKRPHMSCSLLTPFKMHNQNKLEVKAWHKKTTRTMKGSCGFLPSLPY
jgi:transposase InsO family protein